MGRVPSLKRQIHAHTAHMKLLARIDPGIIADVVGRIEQGQPAKRITQESAVSYELYLAIRRKHFNPPASGRFNKNDRPIRKSCH